jgi:hypothetical protein
MFSRVCDIFLVCFLIAGLLGAVVLLSSHFSPQPGDKAARISFAKPVFMLHPSPEKRNPEAPIDMGQSPGATKPCLLPRGVEDACTKAGGTAEMDCYPGISASLAVIHCRFVSEYSHAK